VSGAGAIKKSGRAAHGFTLIEVLVAIVVIGLAATATSRGIQATTNLLGENAFYDEAITQAQETLEDLRAVRYEDMTSGSRTSGVYTISWTVTPDTPGPGMKFVAVTSAWEWKGEPRSYVLHTVYSKITPN
jgi:prepilin-type N-terminal cleavage/methylation domain-containing protein